MINCLCNAPDNFRLKVSQIPYHRCHQLDVIRTYAGEVRTVEALGIKWINLKYPSPDNVVALFEFENGSIGNFHYSSMSYYQGGFFVVHYENYTLMFKNGSGLEIWHRPPHRSQREGDTLFGRSAELNASSRPDCRKTYHSNIGPDKYTFGGGDHAVATALIMTDFLDAVRQGTPMSVTLEDGYKAAELADAIEMSYTQGRKIELPLKF